MAFFARSRRWGIILLAAWRILSVVLLLAHITFANSELILAALAVAAGVLLLLDR